MFRLLPVLVLLFGAAAPGTAAIYKCTDGKDHIAYQAQPCAAHLRGELVAIKPAPAPQAVEAAARARDNAALPPVGGTAPSGSGAQARRRAPGNRTGAAAVQRPADTAGASWECRVATGEVFYQHSPCPDRVGSAISRRRSGGAEAAVSGRTLPRSEACRRIHAASASDRAGHERDEDVDTYERNLGRDPCR